MLYFSNICGKKIIDIAILVFRFDIVRSILLFAEKANRPRTLYSVSEFFSARYILALTKSKDYNCKWGTSIILHLISNIQYRNCDLTFMYNFYHFYSCTLVKTCPFNRHIRKRAHQASENRKGIESYWKCLVQSTIIKVIGNTLQWRVYMLPLFIRMSNKSIDVEKNYTTFIPLSS